LGAEIFGLIVFIAFGAWWVVALPRSVIRFYEWFHRGAVKLPSPRVVRVIGAVWNTAARVAFEVIE
jgi:hypothetical protein